MATQSDTFSSCAISFCAQFLTALVIWTLPMALWPFRSLLLPDAADESKKRLGSSPIEAASEKISPAVIEEGELKDAFYKVVAPRGLMIFALLDVGFVSTEIVAYSDTGNNYTVSIQLSDP